MILFTAGDEHVAGAMATNNYIYAHEDQSHGLLGNKPHPDNLFKSWSNKVAYALKMSLEGSPPCQTNQDIIKVTDDWIEQVSDRLAPEDVFIIIGWLPLKENESPVHIRNYHVYLDQIGIKHLFFSSTEKIDIDYNFGINYVDETYIEYIKNKDLEPVLTSDVYYGEDAHTEWAKYLILHIAKNNLL